MYKQFFFCLLAVLPLSLFAQRESSSSSIINGDTQVLIGQTYSYTLTTGQATNWSCTGCEFQFAENYDPKKDGWTNSVNVKWSGEGRTILSVQTKNGQFGAIRVSATCGNQIAPMPSLAEVSQIPNFCLGKTELSINFNNADWDYFWQTSSSGTSTLAKNSYNANNSTTYYLRAKSTWGCWASNVLSVNTTVPTAPVVNAPKLISDCGPAQLELNNTNTSDFTYYWQTSLTGTDQSHQELTRPVTQSGDYFVRAYHLTSGCWTPASSGVHVSSEVVIEQPPTDSNSINIPTVNNGFENTGIVNKPLGNQATMNQMNNYVRVYTPLEAFSDEAEVIAHANDPSKVAVTTTYYDGLGRPTQTVQKKASPNENDIISFHQYDPFGREVRKYLPYANTNGVNDGNFKPNAPIDQYNFYQNANHIAHTDWAFSQTEFENSPLNRVTGEFAPGKSWVGSNRGVQSGFRINTAEEGIRAWDVTDHPDGSMQLVQHSYSNGVYADGDLLIYKTTNEQGNSSWEYKTKLGETILLKAELGDGTFSETYYVYGTFGRLRYTIPPNAVQLLSEHNFDPQFGGDVNLQEQFNNLIYYYKYNSHGKAVISKVPSQDGEIHAVYDRLDRIILRQTPKQREQNEWEFTQYNVFSKVISTGICTIENKTHEELYKEWRLKTVRNQFDENTNDYAWDKFPFNDPAVTNIELRTVNYFNDYEAVDLNRYDFQPVAEFSEPHFTSQQNRVNGLPTASRVKILDDTNTWLWAVNHYDERGRVIQVVADNHLGGKAVTSTLYHDFNSRVLKTKLTHTVYGETTEILKEFAYDHRGRVLSVHYQINGQDPELLAEFEYNELGEMITKRLGNNLQKIDYAYNIRGWLTKINGVDLDIPETNEPKDLWGMEMSYDKGFSKSQYSGNIAGIQWTSSQDDRVHAYGYQYDKLNRLTQADYRHNQTGSWTTLGQDFTVFGVTYDLNGNIQKLNRQGAIGKDAQGNWIFGAMDRLEYTYNPLNSNSLIAVDDKAASIAIGGDFMDINQLFCATNQVEYQYDANGNLISDANKNLTGITYNTQNLVTETQTAEGKLKYLYDATGMKLRKEVYDENNQLQSSIDYLGELSYKNQQLEFIHHDEGRVLPSEDGVFKFEYHYKDHLGNLRLSFREEEVTAIATLEIANQDEENQKFDHIEETRIYSANNNLGFARTGESASQLNSNFANKVMGVATVLEVEKGDSLYFTAYSKYSATSNFNPRNIILPAIGATNNFGIEGSSLFGNGTGISFNQLTTPNSSASSPQAYAIVHIIDEAGNVLESKHEFIQNIRNQYNRLSIEMEIEHTGYAVVYLANESPVDVNFDDIEVKHRRLVWQENNYYPFGMSILPLDKTGMPEHRFKYNGIEHEAKTGLNETFFRLHDPQTGRFLHIDPKVEKYSSYSPYTAMLNNPIRYSDFLGDDPPDRVLQHQVSKGQTLYAIAKATGTTVDQLKQWNNISDPTQLQAGQSLNIENPNVMSRNTVITKTYSYTFNEDGTHTVSYTENTTSEVVNTETGEVVRSSNEITGGGSTTIGIKDGIAQTLSYTGNDEDKILSSLTNRFISQLSTNPSFNPYSATEQSCNNCERFGGILPNSLSKVIGNPKVYGGVGAGNAVYSVAGKVGLKVNPYTQAAGWGVAVGGYLGDRYREYANHQGRSSELFTVFQKKWLK